MNRKQQKLVTVLLLFLFVSVLLRSAWLADDAYITFRTVDNFINGYGLRWNVTERVQTYTHPLWMFLVSFLYYFTNEIYYSVISLSVLITMFALLLIYSHIATTFSLAVFAFVTLLSSKAFIDYAASGLENPLTHLTLAIFFVVYFKSKTVTPKTLFLLSFWTAIGAVNRLDTTLIIAPALSYSLLRFGRIQGLYYAALGFLPLALWECFSLFYYGFLFPNTAYAKLNTEIGRSELIERGINYFSNSIEVDPVTISVIAISMGVTTLSRSWRHLAGGLGVVLYLAYIVFIGGDFMSGRFLTAPLFVSTILLVSNPLLSSRPGLVWTATSVIFLGGIFSPYPPLLNGDHDGVDRTKMGVAGVIDERRAHYQASGLLNVIKADRFPIHPWAKWGEAARENAPCIAVIGSIGQFGFYAGPNVHIVDFFAVGDPLLARLPLEYLHWMPGHYRRQIPDGYLETIASGENLITAENLAKYYDRLSLVLRGSLFDLVRLKTILNFNLGKYNHLLDINERIVRVNIADFKLPKHIEHYSGIEIDLNKRRYNRYIDFRVRNDQKLPLNDNTNIYKEKLCPLNKITHTDLLRENDEVVLRLFYINDNKMVSEQIAVLPLTTPEGMTKFTIAVPEEAFNAGYDKIRIFNNRDGFLDNVVGKDLLSTALYNIYQIELNTP